MAECRTTCGFCERKGSHLGEDCFRKDQIKQNFVEGKIRKFGVAAESLALSLVSPRGITFIDDNEFQRRLKGQPIQPNGRTYEDYRQRSRQTD